MERAAGIRPEAAPLAAAKLVTAELVGLHGIRARFAFWPLQPGWAVVTPAPGDVYCPGLPARWRPETAWRPVPLTEAEAEGGCLLAVFEWRRAAANGG